MPPLSPESIDFLRPSWSYSGDNTGQYRWCSERDSRLPLEGSNSWGRSSGFHHRQRSMCADAVCELMENQVFDYDWLLP
jgi:hypothetical protein